MKSGQLLRRILTVGGGLIPFVIWGILATHAYGKLTYPTTFFSQFRTSDGMLSAVLEIPHPSEELMRTLNALPAGDVLFVAPPDDTQASLIGFHIAYLGAPRPYVPVTCEKGVAEIIRNQEAPIAGVVFHLANAPSGAVLRSVGPHLSVMLPPRQFDAGSLCR